MDNTSSAIQELRQLWNGFIDNRLDASQQERFDALLHDSADMRAEFIELMEMHCSLSRYLSPQKNFEPPFGDTTLPGEILPGEMDPSIESFDDIDLSAVLALEAENQRDKEKQAEQEEKTNPPLFGFLQNLPGYFSQNTFHVLVILALLLPSALAFVLFFSSARYQTAVAVNPIVTQTSSASWGGNLPGPIRAGYELTKGQEYTLNSGLAEVLFPNEASIVVHGPATFVATSDKLVHLDSGRCVAHVPESAHGFTIEANGTKIVDLGTEFGVETNTEKETDVYVFKGKVELFLKDAPQAVKIELTENGGVRSSAEKGTIQPRKINANRFVRAFDGNVVPISFNIKNASFEQPDLADPQFSDSSFGNTIQPDGTLLPQKIPFWHTNSQKNLDTGFYRWAAKHGSLDQSGVTDGNQAAILTLCNGSTANTKAGNDVWIYYPLGKVSALDVGQSLKLSVDCLAKTPNQEHDAEITVGFATDTSAQSSGAFIGTKGKTSGDHVWKKPRTVDAQATLIEEIVGHKLFVVIRIKDASPGSVRDMYLIDNVQLFCAP